MTANRRAQRSESQGGSGDDEIQPTNQLTMVFWAGKFIYATTSEPKARQWVEQQHWSKHYSIRPYTLGQILDH